ncbi:MAG: iron-containing alcohol dehydrogenase [Nitrososphaerota archaeon]
MPPSLLTVPEIRLGEKFDCSCGRVHKVATRQILFGDSLGELLDLVTSGIDPRGPVAVVTGHKTRSIAGELVKAHFSKHGYGSVVFEVERADIGTVSELERVASNCSLAVAVGGGTVIDVCKYAAHRLGIPFISIPTTISHDGISSPVASILLGSRRTSLMATPPQTVVITEPLIKLSPRRLISSGCADILAKTTSLRDWLLGHLVKDEYFCKTTFNLTASALLDIRRFIDAGCSNVLLLASAAVKCGLAMTLAESSRPCSGAEHLFSHYLDLVGEGSGLHGEQVGIGAILMAARYEDFDSLPEQGSELTFQELRSYLGRAGAPTSITDIKVSSEVALKALLECKNLRPERYTILHHAPLTPTGAYSLLKKTGMVTEP